MALYDRIRQMIHQDTRDERDSDYATILIDMLMLKEVKNLMTEIGALCVKNHNGENHPSSYYYEGNLYVPLQFAKFDSSPVGTIPEPLEDEAERLKVWKDKIDFDAQMMIQNLSSVLDGTATLIEIRNRIPDELAMVIPELRGMQRTEEELYFITPDTEQLRENYTQAKDLILYYVGNQLLM